MTSNTFINNNYYVARVCVCEETVSHSQVSLSILRGGGGGEGP